MPFHESLVVLEMSSVGKINVWSVYTTNKSEKSAVSECVIFARTVNYRVHYLIKLNVDKSFSMYTMLYFNSTSYFRVNKIQQRHSSKKVVFKHHYKLGIV